MENAHYEQNDITLIVSIDFGGSKEVLEPAPNFTWTHGDKKVRTFSENQGLKKHLIQCGDYSLEYGAAIIFEDDIMPSPYFYDYVQQALDYYKDDQRIIAIGLYSQRWNGYANRLFEPLNKGSDAYVSQVVCSWGECIIGERWKGFKDWLKEHDEKLEYSYEVPHPAFYWKHSWCKYLMYYITSHDKYFVIPYLSLATNFNNAGTHMMEDSSVFHQPMVFGKRRYQFDRFENMTKYDAFSENLDLKYELQEKYNQKVCIDYFGTRRNHNSYDLCLSSVLLPYEVRETFGLEMRPYELNYWYQVPGEDLYLYDLHKPVKSHRNY